MSIVTPYIPREYLALRINYCKQQLAELPNVVRSERNIRGEKKTVLVSESHCYSLNSTSGRKLAEVIQRRELLSCELSRLEGLWNSAFRGLPPADIEPRKIIRSFVDSTGESVIIDGKFFESLKHDSNPYYPEHKTHYYNGTYYRSAAEADIARFYTEQGIPFKYEPEIWLSGMSRPIYSDFVILGLRTQLITRARPPQLTIIIRAQVCFLNWMSSILMMLITFLLISELFTPNLTPSSMIHCLAWILLCKPEAVAFLSA